MKKIAFGLAMILMSSSHLLANTITLTAEFTPSVSSPQNNKFTNTTANYGYCVTHASYCSSNDWFSVALGINSKPTQSILNGDGLTFNMPSAYKDIVVKNRATGKEKVAKFAIIGFGARMAGNGGDVSHINNNWSGGVWLYPPRECDGTGWATGGTNTYNWFWRWPARNNTTFCTKTTTANRGPNPQFDQTNFMYLLITPNPLEMDDGVYDGEIKYSVAGSNAEINIGGPKYQTSQSEVTIKLVLTVTHEMSVRPVDTSTINMGACQTRKICTETESKVNWEKSTITNIPPVLTAESHFEINSSGSFTTYLSCEVNVGQACGLRSARTGDIVPVQTLLTLPTNIQSSSGSSVRSMVMKNVKDTGYAFFTTTQFQLGNKGKFHFEVDKGDVAKMQKNAPDDYSGIITVIFDPQVW